MKRFKLKKLLFILGLLAATDHFTQTDSTGFKFSGFQVDIGTGLYAGPTYINQQKLQSFVTNDDLLYDDLTGYTSQNYYRTEGEFTGMIGGKVYFKPKKTKRRYELFAGLRYSDAMVAYSAYTKTTYNILHSYFDKGQTYYVINKQIDDYYFAIWGRRLLVPLGINISSNQDKIFWFTAGVEITPFVSFDHRFKSRRSCRSFDIVTASGDELEQAFTGSNDSSMYWQEDQKVKGFGGGVYIGIPLTVNIHPFRKETSFLGCLNFFGTLMPLFVASGTKFSALAYGVQLQVGAGVRVNFTR